MKSEKHKLFKILPDQPQMATPLLLLLILSSFRPAQSHTATSPKFQLPLSTYPHPITLSVRDFGAIGDGLHYDTTAIQSAINSCACTPCRVTFPPGKYLTATIFLRSGVVLEVQKGATLLGGKRMEDYPREAWRWYVVVAENATGVGITGGGVVDGQGLGFVERFDKKKNVMVSWNRTGACLGDECRPRLVGFLGCTNVRVWNVTLREPAYWWCVF